MSPPSPKDPSRDPAPHPAGRSGAHDLAFSDDLTGLHNRRYLRRLFETEWNGLIERQGRVALLLLDLDLFKEVNDNYGHLAGDAVLRATARRLRESFRDGDRVVRYGGDEFVVVLPGAGDEEARAMAERARTALANERWIDPASGRTIELPLSFSVGIAAAPEDGHSGEDVLGLADRQLYEEKRVRRAALDAVLRPPGHRPAPRALVATGAALAAIALVAWVWLDRPRSQPPPLAPAAGQTRWVAAEEIERRETEIRELREEVGRLRTALAGASSAAEKAHFENRIRSLESALSERAVAAGAAGPAPASSPASVAPGPPLELAPAPTSPAPMPAPHRAVPPAPSQMPKMEPPQLLSHRPPVYPPAALARGLEAKVDFRIRVDRDGRVVAVNPLGPPVGGGFDEAARVAARSATYRPGTRDGLPMEMETTLRIEFQQRPER